MDPAHLAARDPYSKLSPEEEDFRSFTCCRFTAEADVAEACYKLGDLLKWGRGCEIDDRAAFHWYSRSYELCDEISPDVVRGSAALRLGESCENDIGCMQDFREGAPLVFACKDKSGCSCPQWRLVL